VTQNDRVLQLLRRQGWVCGTEFEYMRRYSARLFELRQRGFLIVRRSCANPAHRHVSPEFEWQLMGEPNRDGQLAALLEGDL
jgi:hypothetical protein